MAIKTDALSESKTELVSSTTDEYVKAQWFMLYLTMFIYLFFYTGRQNFGFAIVGIQEDLGLTPVHTGMISGAMLLVYGAGQTINGYLGDKFSARKMITLGALLSCLFNLCMSYSLGFISLLIFACLNGYVQSLGFPPGSRLIANWWPQHLRGKAFGLFLLSSGFSSVLTYGLCIVILMYFSWEWLFRLPIIFLTVAALIFYFLVKDTPKQAGFDVQHELVTTQAEKAQKIFTYKDLFMNGQFMAACFSMGFNNMARYGLLIWLPAYYIGLAKTGSDLTWVSVALPLGMSIGTVVSGELSDKYFNSNRSKPVILFMFLTTLFIALISVIPEQYLLLEFVCLFIAGFLIYGAQTPLFALCPDMLGTGQTAKAVGLMNGFAYVFAAAGEVIIGYMLRAYDNNLNILFSLVAVICLLSGASALLIKR